MSTTEKERQFLHIAITHIRRLHDNPSINRSAAGQISSYADDYVRLNHDDIRIINETKEAYNGVERKKILEVHEDQKAFHAESARTIAQEVLDRVILKLSDDWVYLERGDLRRNLLRKKFDKALHDVGTRVDGRWQDINVYGEEVDRERLPPLSCYALSDNDLDVIDGFFSEIGEHRTRIEALKKIRIELGKIGPKEEQTYVAGPEKREVETMADLGDLLFERWRETGKSRSSLVSEGVDKYIIRDRLDYRWKPNAYRDAINKSLKRRIEKYRQEKSQANHRADTRRNGRLNGE